MEDNLDLDLEELDDLEEHESSESSEDDDESDETSRAGFAEASGSTAAGVATVVGTDGTLEVTGGGLVAIMSVMEERKLVSIRDILSSNFFSRADTSEETEVGGLGTDFTTCVATGVATAATVGMAPASLEAPVFAPF